MAGRKILRPTSRAESERMIIRKQRRYEAGVYSDVPASTISDNGLALSENFINYGNRLHGRAGSKLHSNTALPTIENRGPYSATKSGNIVTLSSGDITSADIGSYVYWSDTRKYERITGVTSTTVFTVHTSNTHSAVADMTLTGAYNGGFWHKEKNKVLHHVYNELYSSDYDCNTYTKCIRNSILTPDRFKTTKDEFQEFVYVFSNKAIFKVDFSKSTPIYYPINAPIPTVKIDDFGTQSRTNPYGYRYIYTLTRLSGTGNTRDRNTSGVKIELETGGVKYSKTEFDYGEIWQDAEVNSPNNIKVSPLTCPVDPITGTPHTHFTHYSVYRTLNIGSSGVDGVTGSPNNTELYIWVADVPIVKAFTANQLGNAVGASKGAFTVADVGSTLLFADGSTTTIETVLRSGEVTVSNSQTVLEQSAVIGSTTVLTASQSGTTVTRTGGRTFAVTDVGKTLWWADGRTSIITDHISATQVTVNTSQTVESMGATLDPVSRSYNDTFTDDEVRINIGAWVLFSRFFDALPQTNVGLVVPGFMFAAQSNSNNVFYCGMEKDFEYLTGYYYPRTQFAYIKDNIVALREFPDRLIVYCKNSTHEIPLNNFQIEEISSIGVSLTTIVGQNVVDQSIGCADIGSIRAFGYGKEMMVTNDFGLRHFDGQQFTENLVQNRIMKEMLKMQPAFASSYDEENGYILCGRQP
jgi:hypothetical protein